MITPEAVKRCEQSHRERSFNALSLAPLAGRANREPPWRWSGLAGVVTDTPKPPGDSPDFAAIVVAAQRAGTGDTGGQSDLFLGLLCHQGRLEVALEYYRGASWDLAYDAALDLNIGIVEAAAKRKLVLPDESRVLWRFLYRRATRQLWLNRRQAKETAEKRRGKAARRANPARTHLPRFIRGSEELLRIVAPGKSPVEHAFAREAFSRVREVAALNLPRAQRTIFFARLENLPFDEIARMAGTTPGAARVHYLKASRELRALFGEVA